MGLSRMSASNLVATVSDYLPEDVALAATLGGGRHAGVLLALLIALQNLPEGFNAYREMMAGGGLSSRFVLVGFVAFAFVGPVFAVVGNLFLKDHRKRLLHSRSLPQVAFFIVSSKMLHLSKNWKKMVAADRVDVGVFAGFDWSVAGELNGNLPAACALPRAPAGGSFPREESFSCLFRRGKVFSSPVFP